MKKNSGGSTIRDMNTRTYKILGSVALAALIVAGVLAALQGFNAGKVACDKIADARAELQALYETGINASVQMFGEEKAETDEQLSQCLSAKPADPCADAQKARDAAVEKYNGITSPPDTVSYAEFQTYFEKRESAYGAYKKAKEALDQCRAANPPKTEVPYEQSDTKACFDAYDVSINASRDTFSKNTQAMRAALTAALSALDAREKACNPPTGRERFTDPPREGDATPEGGSPAHLASCRPLNADLDTELFTLRKRAAAIPGEVQAVETSIENVDKRMKALKGDLSEVGTYIPPESTKTQYEGALNALRAERKVAIESALAFYEKLRERKQAEKATLEEELRTIEANIKERLAEIEQENAERKRKFPTALHLAGPDECAYYHCHGTLCGVPDPDPAGCGQGATTQDDTQCTQFLNSYYKEAGI